MKTAIRQININPNQVITPFEKIALMYWGFFTGFIHALPLQLSIGVPALIITVWLVWFWYNFLR
jgi:hypothetical protein